MTNLLDLPLDQFRGYLAEGNYPQARQDELMRAYRAKNSLAGWLDRYGEDAYKGRLGLLDDGNMKVSSYFPVAVPKGMSIWDGLKSGRFQTRFKDYASDALGGVLNALNNPRDSYQGTLPQADYDSAAMGTGGLAMGGGGVVAGRLPDGAVAANIPVGSKVYRQDSLKPNYVGEGAVYYTPDKTYTENYASDGRVLKTATVPDSIVDTYTDFGRAKALNWIKGQYDEYLKLSTSGELTRITPELKYISKILDKETTSAQDIAQAMANLNLIYGRQTGKNNSSAAEKRFLEAVDADAITGWESNGVPSIAFRNAPAANASKSAGLLAMNQAPMIAHHNTSLAGLKAARDIGGIPMPSIAISNAKTPVENFGDISLLMRPDQIDPKSGVNVFPADGYTGRQPKGFFDFTNESTAREALRNDPDFGHFGSSWIDSTNGFSDANYMMQVAQFGRDRGIGNPKDFKEIRDYNSFVQKQIYKFGDETDQTAFSQISDKDGLTAYGETQMLINPKEPYTPSGLRRDPKPYTLDEAYKRMRQNKANQAGSEGHSGPGLLRAVSSKQFKSLDEIKKNRGLLKPDDNDMADVKGGWDTFSYDAIDDLAKAHFDGRHRVAEDYVTDLASGKSVSWAEATPEARTAAQGTIKALREEAKGMPTEYFEAKPKSVQTLGDFDTALVPAGNQEAIDILRRQGVKNIQEYGDQKTRAQLMQEQENLLFANASKSAGLLAASLPEPSNAGEAMAKIKPGDTVSGLTTGETVPNIDSIGATLQNWDDLGLRSVPIDIFDAKPENIGLAQQIKKSGRIEPLIVVNPKDGSSPYVLEGSHRIGALKHLGVSHIPAKVINEKTSYSVSARGGRIFVHEVGSDKPVSVHADGGAAWDAADKLNGTVNANASKSAGVYGLLGANSLDEVVSFTSGGKPIYHSGDSSMAEEAHKYGVEPQYGSWITEIAQYASDFDGPGGVQAFLDEMPTAAWWSEQPDWIRAKVARAAGKNARDVNDEDIKRYGHLAIADGSEFEDDVFRIGEDGLDYGEGSPVQNLAGEKMKLYETPLYEHGDDGVGRYPFGIERNELVTRETIDPKFTLTGDALLQYMKRYNLANASAPVGLLAAQPSTEDELRQYLMQRGLLQ